MAPLPGDVAPPFTATTDSNTTFSLHEAAGSWLLLWWFPKASTPTCTREGCAFRDRSAAFAGRNCIVAGISYDSSEDNRAFAEAHGFEFPLLSDPDRAISAAYGAVRPAGEPWDDMPYRVSFLIDPSGLVHGTYEVTDADAHAGEVLQDLDRALPERAAVSDGRSTDGAG